MRYGVELPSHIGPYAVERELGAGGMGMVYLARSRGGRTVAVKVARPELAADPHFRARFRAEVEAARKVGGFHTAQVVDADPEADTPWLATAYVAGPTLAGLIDAQGPMDEVRLRSLGAALAEALGAIHGCGLIHRDLKPGNIIMAEDGPRVLDFGIARAVESTRLTSTGAAFGTPGFLAPEQAQGLEVGPAADVFALGAVLVAAAGGSAFGGGTPMGLMYRSVHETPDLSAVPAGLRPVIADCLAKDPAGRPTPERLLDLFAPQPAAQPQAPAHPPTVAVAPPQPPADRAPSQPPADRGGEDAVTAGALHDLATQPAAAAGSPSPAPASPSPSPAPSPSRTARNWRVAIAAALLVVGGFVATQLAGNPGGDGGGDDASFPKAEYELTRPLELVDGAYTLNDTYIPDPRPLDDSDAQKDALAISATYDGAGGNGAFQSLQVNGEYGRFKEANVDMEPTINSMLVTNEQTFHEPLRKIQVPGSKTRFTCRSASSSSYGTATVCAWSDLNTRGAVQFIGGANLDRAAKEADQIRKEMTRPVTGPGY
uniref:serine/threonine-protein kinase n=1 Tax=Streptomyces polyasparticus TaxID=2767826 RepID=UPI003F6829EE